MEGTARMTTRPNPLTAPEPRRAAARAMLKAVGFNDADLEKPLIGVANTWIEIGPCNYHLRALAVHGLVLYGGSIAPGQWHGKDVTIQDVFEAVGAQAAGKITLDDLRSLESAACPGAGACGGQFTANTMAIAVEFLGIAALGSGSVPSTHAGKADVARAAGERVMQLVRSGLKPRDIMTRAALEN